MTTPSAPATATINVGKASNEFSFETSRNKKKGTALLTAALPGAGSLELAGSKVESATTEVSGAGDTELAIKAIGKAKKKLKKKKGAAKVAFDVTFSPTGGDHATEPGSLKLLKKKK